MLVYTSTHCSCSYILCAHTHTQMHTHTLTYTLCTQREGNRGRWFREMGYSNYCPIIGLSGCPTFNTPNGKFTGTDSQNGHDKSGRYPAHPVIRLGSKLVTCSNDTQWTLNAPGNAGKKL